MMIKHVFVMWCCTLFSVDQGFVSLIFSQAKDVEYVRRQSCIMKTESEEWPNSDSRDGDVIIGGILQISLHSTEEKYTFKDYQPGQFCLFSSFRYLRHMLAFIYAIEEINNSPGILPNITLGFHIYDACANEVVALKSVLCTVSEDQVPTPNYFCKKNQKMLAIVGHLISPVTYVISQIAQLYGYPQISYGALNRDYKEKSVLPTIYKTVPNEYSQFNVIIQLLVHFRWTWVGLITSDGMNDDAIEYFRLELKSMGICIEFHMHISQNSQTIDLTNRRIVNVIHRSTSNVILLYCNALLLISLLQYASDHLSVDKVYVLFVSMNIPTDYDFTRYLHVINGSIILSVHSGRIPGLANFSLETMWTDNPSNTFITNFLLINMNCPHLSLSNLNETRDCSKNALKNHHLLQDKTEIYYMTYALYTAVYTIAHALNKMYLAQEILTSKEWLPRAKYKLKYYLKNLLFQLDSGNEMFFDHNGDAPTNFDFLNWIVYENNIIRKVHFGNFFFSLNPQLYINDTLISWKPSFNETPSSTCSKSCSTGHRKSFQRGKQTCCFTCVLCPEGAFTNLTGSDECLMCPKDHYSAYTRDVCLKRQLDFLSFEDSLGVLLANFSVVLCLISAAVLWIFVNYRNTPIVKTNNRNLTYVLLTSLMLSFLSCLLFIGHPTEMICLLREATFSVTYATAISSVLGKALTVIVAFTSIRPGHNMRKCIGPMFSLSLVIMFSFGELIICITWLIVAPPFLDFDLTTIKDKMILQCNPGSIYAFYITIAYVGMLAFSSFVVAFNVRKLPDRFNEAQYITFSMLVFCSVWMAFIPAYLSAKGKYLVVVQVFAMLASSGGLLICIFFPKCYIVLVRPDLNIKETINAKKH